MQMLGWRIPLILFCFLSVPYPLQGACREINVARGFTRLAYAAEPDAITIQYFGHNFFKITTGKGTKIVTDPLAPGISPAPNVAPHIVTVGREHPNHNSVALARGNPVILRGLIDFGADWNRISMSIRDVFIYNIPIYQNSDGGSSKGAAFVFDLGTVCIAHLGNLSHLLNPEQLKQIGKVDIALIPIDGTLTMGPGVARQVLRQLKPRIAIPMHYGGNLSLVGELTRGFNWYHLRGDSLTVSKSVLPPSTEIFILKPQDTRDQRKSRLLTPNAVIDPDVKEKGYLGNDGRSKMPDFSDVVRIGQFADLTAYLASPEGPKQKAHR